jgi:pSer/pThr/pTyr-binding forkhead associated (FHA) protein
MSDIKVCPACSAQNTITDTNCTKCATPLVALLPARITVPVPESLKNKPFIPPAKPPQVQPKADSLSLTVAGSDVPMLVKNDIKKITLGRLSPGESSPTVDLTPYDAHLMGVSRLHAIVFRTENGTFVQDQDSTNGTFLNDKKLTPNKLYEVKNGDIVRLGQLGIYVHFESGILSQKVIITDDSAGDLLMITPQFLETRLMPFLSGLANAQKVVDTFKERTTSVVAIKSIAYSDPNRVEVLIQGCSDVIGLFESRINTWRKLYSMKIYEIRKVLDQAKQDNSPEAQQKLRTQTGPLRAEMREYMGQLASDCVRDIIPDMDASKRAEYAEKLMPAIQTLIFSPLQIMIDVESVVIAQRELE